MKITSVILLFLLSFSACKKAETTSYGGGQGISFYLSESAIDSVNYTFADQAIAVVKDTIYLQMRISGKSVAYDREIEVVPVEGTTAVRDVNYAISNMKLPADSFTVNYPVILFKTADLNTKTYRLVLKVKENNDFIQGAIGRTGPTAYNIAQYKINFNNQLIKPVYWFYVESYFGAYSAVKHKFIIDVIKISDFEPDFVSGTVSYSDFLNYNGMLKNAKRIYEAQYGLLVDETGKEITFPL